MDSVASRLDFSSDAATAVPTVEVSQRTTNVSFQTIHNLADVESLRTDWVDLFETCGRPHQVFQSCEWLSIWASLFVDASTRPAIVVGRLDGQLVLVWPLVVHRRFGLRVLCGMGAPLSQYDDAIMSPRLGPADEDALFDHVAALPADVVSLRRVRADAAIAPMLQRRLGAPVNGQASPFIDLRGIESDEAFEARFPSKVRSSRRRRRRRLEERGAVAFTHHAPSPEAEELADIALRFKCDWAREAGVLSPSLRDPRFAAFFACAAAEPACPLRVSALRCADEILGVEISVLSKGHLIGHVLAPKPDLPQLGLGSLLAEATILNARRQGYVSMDLLAPADPYKLEWTSTSVEVGDYFIARNIRGNLYVRIWLRYGRQALKALSRRCRPALTLAATFVGV